MVSEFGLRGEMGFRVGNSILGKRKMRVEKWMLGLFAEYLEVVVWGWGGGGNCK